MRVLDRLLLLALGAAFLPALWNLARVWASTDSQSHGFVVPAIAAWIAWSGRHRWRRLPHRSDGAGAALLVAALVLYAANLLADSPSGQGLALVAAIAGVVWWREGRPRLRALVFPIAFLLFMVPIPVDWFVLLTNQLLLFVSWAATGVLHALGMDVTRNGNVLVLGNGESLFLAEACSGLTALLTFAPLAVLTAYVSPLTNARRAALVALALPIALVVNLVRILATALAATVWGAATVTAEPWHSSAGVLIYVLACLALVGAAWSMRPGPTGLARSRDGGSR